MTNDDDKNSQNTKNKLGQPSAAIVKFFDDFGPRPRRVLDIGYDQGKDALFIARLGHTVVAVGQSLKGIRDLGAIAKKEQLDISVEIAGFTAFEPDGKFDVILINQTIHVLTEYDRLMVFNRLIDHILVGGWVLVAEGKNSLEHFRQMLNTHNVRWMIDNLRKEYLFASRLEE